jgi:O-acetylhomoserine (thiol)-lyase
MSGPRYPGFDTLSLHAGAAPDPATGARATPVYFTSAFALRDADQAAALFNMERSGHVYSRLSNPTNAVLEERIAALEGGVAGLATASGQAALHLGLSTIAGAGSHIVASTALDGGSHNLLAYTLRRFGIETTFVDPRQLDAWRAAIRPNTKVLFAETLGNPGLEVLDVARAAALAHEHDLPLMVDSTFTTPYLLRPFEHGADLVFHSATKFLCGHGTAIGGLLVDGGSFDWQRAYERSGRFAELCEPYDGFHGMVFTEESTVGAFALRTRREGLRDFGAVMSPHNAFAVLQGIETLGLRMERHVANTRKVVEYLARHPAAQQGRGAGQRRGDRALAAGRQPLVARVDRAQTIVPGAGLLRDGRRAAPDAAHVGTEPAAPVPYRSRGVQRVRGRRGGGAGGALPGAVHLRRPRHDDPAALDYIAHGRDRACRDRDGRRRPCADGRAAGRRARRAVRVRDKRSGNLAGRLRFRDRRRGALTSPRNARPASGPFPAPPRFRRAASGPRCRAPTALRWPARPPVSPPLPPRPRRTRTAGTRPTA